MNFLELSIWLKAIRGLSALLCDVIYTLISKVYELFMTVARLNILSSDQIAPIYQRVTMILTIIMTFYITFEFVKYTIQPDNFTDKEKGVGNILQRIVIVVALIAFMPNIFKLAYDLQSRIIETNLISKMLLGTSKTDYTSYGNDFSANMLNLFYYYDEDACANGGGDCNEAKSIVEENLEHIRKSGDSDIVSGINAESTKNIFKEKFPAIKFNVILAPLIGGIVLYILILYSIDVGARYAQLIFLQVMSPIAIIGYILPKKDGIFQKWGKQCITTYIDLFLRLIIINFVLLLVKTLGDAFNSGDIFAGLGEVSASLKVFTYIVLVIGLLVFAQRAPKLLGELLPSTGGAAGLGFGLGAKGRFEPIRNMFKGAQKTVSSAANAAGRVVGGVGGALAGAAVGKGLRGRLRTAVTGAKEGAKKDNKGLPHRRIERAQEAARQRTYREDEIERSVPGPNVEGGITREGAIRQATYHKERWANIAAEQDRKAKLYDIPKTSLDTLNASIDEFKQVKAIKAELKSAEARGADAWEIKTIDAKYKATCQAIRREVVKNGGDLSKINYDVNIEWDVLDNNGFKTGRKNSTKLVLDSGDQNYAGTIDRTASNELKKIREAAAELSNDPLTRDTFNKTTIKLNINGTDMEKTINEWLHYEVIDPATGEKKDISREIYAEFANKFKDAMVDPKNEYENTAEYAKAHAFKDGITDGGGKK